MMSKSVSDTLGFPFSHSKDVCPRQDGEGIANRGEAPSQVRQASFARAGRSTGLPKRTESPNGRARGRFPDKADRYSAATKAGSTSFTSPTRP